MAIHKRQRKQTRTELKTQTWENQWLNCCEWNKLFQFNKEIQRNARLIALKCCTKKKRSNIKGKWKQKKKCKKVVEFRKISWADWETSIICPRRSNKTKYLVEQMAVSVSCWHDIFHPRDACYVICLLFSLGSCSSTGRVNWVIAVVTDILTLQASTMTFMCTMHVARSFNDKTEIRCTREH